MKEGIMKIIKKCFWFILTILYLPIMFIIWVEDKIHKKGIRYREKKREKREHDEWFKEKDF